MRLVMHAAAPKPRETTLDGGRLEWKVKECNALEQERPVTAGGRGLCLLSDVQVRPVGVGPAG